MTAAEFAKGIHFRFLRSQSQLKSFWRCQQVLGKFRLSTEIVNTSLPNDRRDSRRVLRELCNIPRMSTYALAAIIDKAVAEMQPDTCFLNVGVWNGFSFLAGLANNPSKTAIGVDNFSEFNGPKEAFLKQFNRYKTDNHKFFEMDYKVYFNTIHRDPIGFYIYDAEHSYENQLAGLQLAEPFFAKQCLIMIDDTNYLTARQATLDFVASRPSRYRIVFDKATRQNCHPTFWNGIMLIQCR